MRIYVPQASNWATDANMGKVCTSVLFIYICRLLPMKRDVETSVKVHIQHDVGDTCVDPEATPDQVQKQVSGLPNFC